MVIEFTGYDRPRRLASTTHLSSMDLQGTLTFDLTPEGTRMQWSWDVEPKGVLKVMTPLVALMGRRQEQRIWTGLKHLLEGPRLVRWRRSTSGGEVVRPGNRETDEVVDSEEAERATNDGRDQSQAFVAADESGLLVVVGLTVPLDLSATGCQDVVHPV
jgi:hypothetical protein